MIAPVSRMLDYSLVSTINYQATTAVVGAAATDVNAYKTPNTRYFNPQHQ